MTQPTRASSLWPAALLGAAAFLPFLLEYHAFRGLFWFGDEFPLINEIDTMRFAHWVWYPFVENILPLFKWLWGEAVRHGGGSYIGMLWGAWIIHAGTVAVFVLWMRRCGFRWGAASFAALLFAWSSSQVETLTWSVQASSQLCTFFFVCGALLLPVRADESLTFKRLAGLLLFSTASAWSFSRGLLTGPVLALTVLVWRGRPSGTRKGVAAALCVLPTLVTAVLMVKGAPENSRHVAWAGAHWLGVMKFALGYLAGNPVFCWWYYYGHGSIFNVSASAVVVGGAVKVLVLAAAWRWAGVGRRRLLLPALLLELGYAALLGLGRGEGDWHNAMGSRYQYNSLLCSLPFLAVVLERLRDATVLSTSGRRAMTAALTLIFSAYSLYGWVRQMPPWVEWRGTGSRQLLLGTASVPAGRSLVGLPTFPNWRAKQLTDKYHLH